MPMADNVCQASHMFAEIAATAGSALALSVPCLIADMLTGTAVWQHYTPRGEDTMSDYVISDDHGSTSDYWGAYGDTIADTDIPILSDDELAALDSSVDYVDGYDDDSVSFLDMVYGESDGY